MNIIFASDKENFYFYSSVFIIKAEEMNAFIKWKRFSNINRLVITVANVQRALSRYKPATPVVSVEDREKAKAIVFRLLQQKQFGEEIKSLKVEKKLQNPIVVALP